MNAPIGQNEGPYPERGGRRSSRRRRAIAAAIVSALVALIAAVVLLKRFRDCVPTIDYPIEPIDGEPAFIAAARAWSENKTPELRIVNVSEDGRWVVLASPSGTRFLTAPSSETLNTDGSSADVRPVLYEIDRTPRRLPVKVPFSSQVFLHLSGVRFLDDNSLIYVHDNCEIRRFDLNTGESELLWQPKSLRAPFPPPEGGKP